MNLVSIFKKFKIRKRIDRNFDPKIVVDSATKFFDYIYIYGWYDPEFGKLISIDVLNPNFSGNKIQCNIPHEGVLSLGMNLGWKISLLLGSVNVLPDEIVLKFNFQGSQSKELKLSDLIDDRLDQIKIDPRIEFKKIIAASTGMKILDIGGRDRSKFDRSRSYPEHFVTVLDIIPGDNVDVVGDAHALSEHFPNESFDIAVSTSVFEHLHSPWKVALELNKVLKIGGLALLQSHQTLGIHDPPWDYWRFSDEAWRALFNKDTGFEVISSKMTHESYIIPFLFRRDKMDAEKSAGFELSTVLVKKISNTNLSWVANTENIARDFYPESEDGFDPNTMRPLF